MRFLKALWLAVFFFAALIFLIQNNDALGQKLALQLDFYFFNYVWKSTAVPFYFVVLAGFLLGALSTLGFLLMDRIRLRLELRRARREARDLQREIKALREIPLQPAPVLIEAAVPASETREAAPDTKA